MLFPFSSAAAAEAEAGGEDSDEELEEDMDAAQGVADAEGGSLAGEPSAASSDEEGGEEAWVDADSEASASDQADLVSSSEVRPKALCR